MVAVVMDTRTHRHPSTVAYTTSRSIGSPDFLGERPPLKLKGPAVRSCRTRSVLQTCKIRPGQIRRLASFELSVQLMNPRHGEMATIGQGAPHTHVPWDDPNGHRVPPFILIRHPIATQPPLPAPDNNVYDSSVRKRVVGALL